MSNSNPSDSATSPNNPSPSVPLSVYRELAAELQATQALLDSLHAQNQQLSRQNQQLAIENQQLHLEITNVVESVGHMRQVAGSFAVGKLGGMPKESAVQPPAHSAQMRRNWEESIPLPSMSQSFAAPKTISEQPMSPMRIYDRVSDDDIDKKWLIGIAVLIIIIAFGTGYWIVRPFIPTR
jgi:hypothetical protein